MRTKLSFLFIYFSLIILVSCNQTNAQKSTIKPQTFSEYDLIFGGRIDELEERVKTALNQGWSLVGGPLTTPDGRSYIQAMAK